MSQSIESTTTASWRELEGITLGDKFQLQNFLFETGSGACFETRVAGEPPSLGWLWLALADDSTDPRQLEFWQIAAGLSHPNLAQVQQSGRVARGVTSMYYLLAEPADEVLATVLRERPLNQVEAREAVLSVAKALSYLHSRALVHGHVDPASILAVGDKIKLSGDTIAPALESGDGVLSTAHDLRGLGASIHTMFTQNAEVDLDHLSAIPQPFRDIVRGCYGVSSGTKLGRTQDAPWTAQRVVAALDLPAVPVAPAAERPALEWVPAPQPRETRKHIPVWVVAPAAVAVAFLVFLLTRKPDHPAPPPVPARSPARTVDTTAGAARLLPSPLGPPIQQAPQAPPKVSELAASRVWRVVSYTYSKAEDSARMVNEINRKWPHLKAEQFSPAGSGPPYYVALGGRMTRNEAVRLQQQAISSGLPHDTFVRNFRR